MVERYRPYGLDVRYVKMYKEEDGDWVRFSDYEALRAERLAGEVEPVAWMRRWAFDGIDVMAMKKADRPAGWQLRAVSDVQCLPDDMPLYTTPPASAIKETATHRHKKRGTDYVLIGIGKMQAEGWGKHHEGVGYSPVDMREVAIYRSVDDGSYWVRPWEEFEDGRFEALAGGAE